MQDNYDLIVVGGGVSGLIAAGRAGELGAKVLVLEKMRSAGRKLLITGKGRCNITNTDDYPEFISHIHPNPRFLSKAFGTFFSKEIVELLERNGLKTNIERGGRIFPETSKAADVLKALMIWIEKLDVDFIYNAEVKEILASQNKVEGVKFVSNGKNNKVNVSKIILCTGPLKPKSINTNSPNSSFDFFPSTQSVALIFLKFKSDRNLGISSNVSSGTNDCLASIIL